MQPGPDDEICDPACGTGGFFLSAYDHIVSNNKLDPDQRKHLRSDAFTGWEIVDNIARLCAMHVLLHGIESPESDSPIHVADALLADPGDRFDMVLSNPPFGRKSSMTIVNEDGEVDEQALTVVLPDNVLFEGGAGETIRRRLLHECDLHTILRLPTGIFYA